MLAGIADRFSRVVQRYLPDALVIAVLMTAVVFIIALAMNPTEPGTIFSAWGDGFWAYLAFTMQMVLLLMTGMTLAAVPFVNRGLASLAKLANKPWKAYLLTFLVSAAAGVCPPTESNTNINKSGNPISENIECLRCCYRNHPIDNELPQT